MSVKTTAHSKAKGNGQACTTRLCNLKKLILVPLLILLLVLSGCGKKAPDATTGPVEPNENTSPISNSNESNKDNEITEEFEELGVSDFEFNNEDVEVYEEEVKATEVVEYAPHSGTFGTRIDIIGNGFSLDVIKKVTINEIELHPFNITDNRIQVLVPVHAKSGDINIELGDKTINVGAFTVLEQSKTLVHSEVIQNTSQEYIVKAEDIKVKIPANVLDTQKTITIEKINNPVVNDLAATAEGTAYSINIENQHEFSEPLEIEIKVPEGYSGSPYVVYFDTKNSLWTPMYCELTENNTFTIYTDHLTDLWFTLWYDSVLSPNGSFQVYYKTGDKLAYSGSSNTKELATDIAKYLEDAMEDYNAVFSDSYKLKNSTGYIRVSEKTYKQPFNILIHSDYNANGGLYSPLSKVIYLPTKYDDLKDVKTTAAHELFHLYQNQKINMFTMDRNKWIIEAIAELASHRVAFPEDKYRTKIWRGTQSTDKMHTLDEVHEYSMASFIDYMLDKSGNSLVDMWQSIIENIIITDLQKPLENYFIKSEELSTLQSNYKNFWIETISDNSPLRCNDPGSLTKRYLLTGEQYGFKYRHNSQGEGTIKFVSIIPRKYKENVPERIFRVQAQGLSNGEISGVYLNNMPTYDIKNGMTADGHKWDKISSTNNNEGYKLYSCQSTEKDAILLSLYSYKKGENVTVVAKEINAKCAPMKISKAVPGKEYTFKFAFKDIFSEATETLLEVDYGDGTVVKKKYSNKEFIGVKGKHKYEDIKNFTAKATLYDITNGKKEKISQLVIPVETDKKITLTASYTVVQQNEDIEFTTNVNNPSYRYEWDFGESTKDGKAKETFSYSKAGDYTPMVKVYDQNNTFIGEASCSIEVKVATVESNEEEDSGEPSITVHSNNIVQGDKVNFSTNIKNKKYNYRWYTSGNLQEGKGLTEITATVMYGDVSVVILDDKEDVVHVIEKYFDVQEAKYNWVLYDTKVTNVENVANGDDSYSAKISNGSATGTIIKNSGQYTVKCKSVWDAFKGTYAVGEVMEAKITNEVTNIKELFDNKEINASFHRTLAFDCDIDVIESYKDNSAEDEVSHLSVMLNSGNSWLLQYMETYEYGEENEVRDVSFSTTAPYVYFSDIDNQELTMVINIYYGYSDNFATIKLYYKPVRAN